ncbi:MAG: acyl-CoA thioesterase [Bacteroidales bacterium]|jgi:acyl-CoA thioester hydrolase|nr:acyl-CoA thioesterase [Bacteroidales bacterium]MDD4641437.1 acyl-CoA thioesterase [Bacteroidales bacterium]
MTTETALYEIRLKVRDYECDLQGIVNNANYQHYLEHARHEFLRSIGLSFADYHYRGIDLVVTRVEIDYKTPLTSGDSFVVNLNMKKEGVRWLFFQEIWNEQSGKLCVKAKVAAVAVVNGRPKNCAEVDAAFNKILAEKE